MTARDTTLIITAFREPASVQAILASLRSAEDLWRIITVVLVAPDAETLECATGLGDANVIAVRDPGRGKLNAMLLGFETASTPIIVWTDGDVLLPPESVSVLLQSFASPTVGLASGRPDTLPGRGLLHSWGRILFDAAHFARTIHSGKGNVVEASGYLYATRRLDVVREVLNRRLQDGTAGYGAEDVHLSHAISDAGYETRYVPEALVYVKNPTTLRDWFKQKIRNVQGHSLVRYRYLVDPGTAVQSFRGEIRAGFSFTRAFGMRSGTFASMVTLGFARVLAWALARPWQFRRGRKLKHRTQWTRIDSTKHS